MPDNIKTVKLVVLGAGGVGKSTLIRRVISGDYIDVEMTVGFDVESWLISTDNSHMIKASLFDFGGQEQFRFFQTPLIVGAKIALLVFDCTKYRTLIALAEWASITMHLPLERKLLVGTKSDLSDRIDEEEIRRYRDILGGIDYISVSSKTGHNIDELKERISTILKDINSHDT